MQQQMMMECAMLVVIVSLCLYGVPAMPDHIIVRTAQGNLRGTMMESYTGKPFFAFRGVRYAESPTEDYRFKPPLPVRPWGEEVRNASTDGPICPQSYAEEMGPAWSEDCLFLNVYSKQLSTSAKQPVMVYFHSGGYAGVTGSSVWEGPQYLLEKDVVLVTLNYRLGALGYVSTGDSVLPGNYGMKDQVEALKWVRQNILNFGGDPAKVTIFGYSAGSASVTLHLVSPLSRGLFHRAIAMSGSLTSGWAMNRRPKDLAVRLAHNLGCLTSDSRLIHSCLLQHSPEQIVNATQSIKDFEYDPIALFAPVIEEGSEKESFLPEDPLQLLRCGQYAQVPVITGVTRDEFSSRGFYILQNESLVEEFNQNFNKISPIEFMYSREGERSRPISAAIRKFYLNDLPIGNKTQVPFMEIYRDALITFSVVQTAKLLAAKNSQPVYLYLFNYQGRFSHKYFPNTQNPLGIAHHDDLIYLFYISKMFPEFNSSYPEENVVQVLSTLWTSFANNSTPSTPCMKTVWQPLKPGQERYLNITHCPEMVPGLPFPNRMAFWETQFPLTGPHQEFY